LLAYLLTYLQNDMPLQHRLSERPSRIASHAKTISGDYIGLLMVRNERQSSFDYCLAEVFQKCST